MLTRLGSLLFGAGGAGGGDGDGAEHLARSLGQVEASDGWVIIGKPETTSDLSPPSSPPPSAPEASPAPLADRQIGRPDAAARPRRHRRSAPASTTVTGTVSPPSSQDGRPALLATATAARAAAVTAAVPTGRLRALSERARTRADRAGLARRGLKRRNDAAAGAAGAAAPRQSRRFIQQPARRGAGTGACW
ncbi:uncharacterized protein LOC144952903 [Lampetra fluviatilis]